MKAGDRVICKNSFGHEQCSHIHIVSGKEYTIKAVKNTMVELNEVSGYWYYSSRFELIHASNKTEEITKRQRFLRPCLEA